MTMRKMDGTGYRWTGNGDGSINCDSIKNLTIRVEKNRYPTIGNLIGTQKYPSTWNFVIPKNLEGLEIDTAVTIFRSNDYDGTHPLAKIGFKDGKHQYGVRYSVPIQRPGNPDNDLGRDIISGHTELDKLVKEIDPIISENNGFSISEIFGNLPKEYEAIKKAFAG